jgi:hypothetical protein
VVLAGVGAAVVALVAVVVVTRGDGGGPGDRCLSDLAARLPADGGAVSGSDLARARDAGLVLDGSVEDLGRATFEVGLRLDPLSERRVQMFDDSTEAMGYEADDVRCWVGGPGPVFVGRGSFDARAVAASTIGENGDLRTAADLIAHDPDGDPAALLDGEGDDGGDRGSAAPAHLGAAVATLDRNDVVSFELIATDDDTDDTPWAGFGLAPGDDWDLLGVWSFATDDEATALREDLIAVIAEGEVGEMIEGEPADLVHQDGSTLWLRAPLTGEAADWRDPLARFDPAVTVGASFGDGT